MPLLKSVPLAMPSATVWLSRSMVELTLRKNSCFASTGQSSASASIRLADAANEDISSATGAYFSAFFIAARSTDAVETIVRLETIFVFASSEKVLNASSGNFASARPAHSRTPSSSDGWAGTASSSLPTLSANASTASSTSLMESCETSPERKKSALSFARNFAVWAEKLSRVSATAEHFASVNFWETSARRPWIWSSVVEKSLVSLTLESTRASQRAFNSLRAAVKSASYSAGIFSSRPVP